MAATGLRALQWGLAGHGAYQAGQAFARGESYDGFMHLGGAGLHATMALRPCFVAGTPLRTPDGSKPIERFRPGDLVLSGVRSVNHTLPDARRRLSGSINR